MVIQTVVGDGILPSLITIECKMVKMVKTFLVAHPPPLCSLFYPEIKQTGWRQVQLQV